MKKILVGLLLCFAATTVQANDHDQYLFAPIASYHMDRESEHCEVNPGLFYQRFFSDRIYGIVGVFKNSPCRTSVNVMVGWESYEKRRLLGVPYGFGVMGGLATGYDIPVVAAPYIRLGHRDSKLSVRVLTIPHPTKGVFGFGVAYKLGK